jgi:hypothetical protein
VSKHWNPDDAIDEARGRLHKVRLPEGAWAGLTLVALACLGTAILLYRLAGPRDPFGG